MKRILVFPLMILFGLSTAIRSQTAILKLTFTANYNGEHVPLDSISIQNLTQGGDTMLYAPDTVLYVFYWADTNNHINNQSLSFSVRQNIPNPFSDFTTISIDIPDKGSVKLSVRNVTGQEVTSLTQKLDPGTHRFNFSPGFDRFYFLSASFNGITKSIKMISKGSSQPGNASLAYSGLELSNLQNVDIDITEGNALPSGNKFRFTGYAMTPPNDIGSSEIEDTPQSNQNYNFKIFGGIRCPGVPTVTDTDGNIYNTVLIGNQCWMQENLKTTKYSNGSSIPNVTEDDAWFKLTTGAYAWQNNDVTWKDHYGALYNWLAVKDTNGICPLGWHVPSYKEWSEVTDFLKSTYYTNGIMLKSCRQMNSPFGENCNTTDHPRWSQYSSFNGTDDFAFSGLPGGARTEKGSFSGVGYEGYWWSSTGYHLSSSIYSFMRSSIGELGVLNESWLAGMAIRCVKDEEVIPPKASFSGSPFGGKVPLTVHFTDLSTNFPTNWFWDFGDGNTSVHKNPTHTYNSPGIYSVKLTVSNAYGTDTGISSNYIHVPANIPCPGMPTVTDIDGNVYLTVLIGNQCWMKENLKTTNYRNGVPIPNETDQENWKNLTTGAYAWYDNDISMKESYGALYNWYAVIDQNGLCPAGWHLPGHAEWNELIELIGGTETPYAKKLQSCRQVNSLLGGDCNAHENPRWNLNSWRYGTDDYGFSGLPGGYRYQNGFYSIGSTAAWWALTDAYSSEAYSLSLDDDGSITEYPIPKFFGMSVRCLRDENMIEPVPDFTSVYSNIAPPLTVTFFDLSTNNPAAWVWDFGDGNTSALQNPTHTYLMSGVYTVCLTVTNSYGENTVIKNKYIKVKLADNIGAPCPDLPTISDIDGNIYNTVLIGNQCWMKENLKTTTYRNGNSIPEVTTNPHWNSLTTGAFSWYGNNESWKDIYGALYNRYAVIDTNGLCPAGWHVADFDECNDLRDYIVGPESFKGDQLKSCRQIDSPVSEDCDTDEHPRWNQHNTHYGTDDYGFTGLPSGVRSQSGGFASIGSKGSWWSTNGYSWFLSYESGNIAMSSLDHSRTGNSVRCLKDDLIQLPDAKFNGNPVKGISPFSVVFSDQSTNKPSTWHWDFGDGNSSTQQNPLHTFETEGIFTVKLTVTNAYGVSTENKINYVKVYNGTGTGAPCPETPTVTDFDGNVYNTVLIGTQCWMKENLRTTAYRNGLPIQNVTDDDYWSKLIMGAYVWYDNDSTWADKYGALYNWYAVMEPGGLCPDGWHVPSYDEYLSLPDFSPYYSSYFGNRYKSCRQVDSPLGGECNTSEHPRWDQHDIEYGTDEYGFSGLPAGARGYTTFSSLGKTAFYWTSSEYKPNEAITIYWYYNYNRVDMGYRPKKLGYSVRCIRDY